MLQRSVDRSCGPAGGDGKDCRTRTTGCRLIRSPLPTVA